MPNTSDTVRLAEAYREIRPGVVCQVDDDDLDKPIIVCYCSLTKRSEDAPQGETTFYKVETSNEPDPYSALINFAKQNSYKLYRTSQDNGIAAAWISKSTKLIKLPDFAAYEGLFIVALAPDYPAYALVDNAEMLIQQLYHLPTQEAKDRWDETVTDCW